ncbi:VOC family protein [candidate division KSB1 bacterium]|nr:VOC family protein [candidate division KSB1 bacterium]
MKTKNTVVRNLGEVAFRVNDMDKMKQFYREVVGLEILGEFAHGVLLKIADGIEVHTQVLGLFDRSVEVSSERSTFDHIAFSISLKDFEPEKIRIEKECGLKVEIMEHHWVGWRSMYFYDPEGNMVEFVCYDPMLDENLTGKKNQG